MHQFLSVIGQRLLDWLFYLDRNIGTWVEQALDTRKKSSVINIQLEVCTITLRPKDVWAGHLQNLVQHMYNDSQIDNLNRTIFRTSVPL